MVPINKDRLEHKSFCCLKLAFGLEVARKRTLCRACVAHIDVFLKHSDFTFVTCVAGRTCSEVRNTEVFSLVVQFLAFEYYKFKDLFSTAVTLGELLLGIHVVECILSTFML